ncbi:MAG TPA: aminotransferase class V-fold PLP-dependent enzyme [Polyangiaceae bacterium]|nr:aminotransferase class V-fold PLP-dependent enzyme [Polyangiaceae bacterium]
MKSHKALFSRALARLPAHRHAAAHSHHLRPDVVKEAQDACTEDALCLADLKWRKFFGEIYPRAQAHVARLLRTGRPENVVFASSTHELLTRLLSCLPTPVEVLTTDSEFHSAARQFRRLEEERLARVTRVPSEPFETFPERFAASARASHDLVFLSHVFFNSGYVVPDLEGLASALAGAIRPSAFVVIDGYHAFAALPIDLARLAARVFYLAGGYKYAMSGEGACFMHAPDGFGPRPVNTGWFAGFTALGEASEGPVPYPADASRFAGATLAPDGLYRFEAVMAMLEREGLDAAAIHERVRTLQERFLARLATRALPNSALLLPGARGNFLTWRTERAPALHQRLAELGVVCDYRHDRLRLGFGLYHDPDDIDALAALVSQLEPRPDP